MGQIKNIKIHIVTDIKKLETDDMNNMRSGIKLVPALKNVSKVVSCVQNSKRLPALLPVNQSRCTSFVPVPQCKRNLHTTCALKELPFGIPSPSLVLKKILLKNIIFPGFDEGDFLEGANGAICYVSNKLSRGELEDLRQVLTEEAWLHQCERYENQPYPEMFFIDSDDIANLRVADIDVKYADDIENSDKKTKEVRILVKLNVAKGLPPDENQLDNVDEEDRREWEEIKEAARNVRVWTKVECSFIRDVTPGIVEMSDWMIESLI